MTDGLKHFISLVYFLRDLLLMFKIPLEQKGLDQMVLDFGINDAILNCLPTDTSHLDTRILLRGECYLAFICLSFF